MPRPTEQPIIVVITDPWKRLVKFVYDDFPEGELKIRIAGGNPIELLEAKRRVRFDKPIPHFSSNPLEHSV